MREEILLALDCSLRLTAVALLERTTVLAAEAEDLGRRQAAELPLMSERLLSVAGLAWRDVGLVAVTNGPGYFTGLRVGAAYGTALAYAIGVKVVPISSLEMLAASFSEKEGAAGVLSIVYSGRKSVYAGSFGHKNPLPVGEYDGPTLEAWRRAAGEAIIAVSDDPERAAEAANLSFSIRCVRPDAATVGRLAQRDRAHAVAPAELRVSYCRGVAGS